MLNNAGRTLLLITRTIFAFIVLGSLAPTVGLLQCNYEEKLSF